MISFRIDWFDPVVQGTLKSLLPGLCFVLLRPDGTVPRSESLRKGLREYGEREEMNQGGNVSSPLGVGNT